MNIETALKKKILKHKSVQKLVNLEIERKIVHLALGFFIGCIVYFLPLMQAIQFLSVLTLIGFLIMDKARNHNIIFVSTLLRRMERQGASYPAFGAATFVFGSLIAMVFLPQNAAVIGIFALAIVDSFSTVIGKVFGKKKLFGNKTFEGFLGGFLPCVLFLLFVLSNPLIALTVAFTASVLELVLPFDDNLVLPIISGGLFALLVQI